MRASTIYPFFMRLIHWSTLVLVLLGVTLVLLREEIEGKSLKRWLLMSHQTAGLLVLCLVVIRLVALMKYRQRLPMHDLSLWIHLLAKFIHAVLYLALLVVPLLGWWYVSAKGHPPMLFGLLTLPALSVEDMDLADTLSEWHAWLAYGFLAVVAVHALAAVYHHWVKKDGVLTSMWPR